MERTAQYCHGRNASKIKKDSTFLSRNNFMLLRGAYASTDIVDQKTVELVENITAENFPFSIVQKPGKYQFAWQN